MSLSFIIFRIISGAALLIVGFLTANSFFAKNPLFNLPYFGQTLVAFVAGAAGLYVIPYLVVYIFQTIVRWLTTIIQVTVQTTVAKAMGSFFAAQAGKFRGGKGQKVVVQEELPQLANSGPIVNGSRRPVILDTSAVIDGRIFDVSQSGFLGGDLIVPVFVVNELQTLADSADDLKRQRGRRGLNLLDTARKAGDVSVWDGEVLGGDVDAKLTKLAKKLKAKIATVDYNLNKAASVSGLKILNVNDLANLLKTVILPGEKIKVRLIQTGKDVSQGVGYLPDGTMIVVEGGAERLGQEVEAEVSRLLQSSAGKMIFAKLPSQHSPRPGL